MRIHPAFVKKVVGLPEYSIAQVLVQRVYEPEDGCLLVSHCCIPPIYAVGRSDIKFSFPSRCGERHELQRRYAHVEDQQQPEKSLRIFGVIRVPPITKHLESACVVPGFLGFVVPFLQIVVSTPFVRVLVLQGSDCLWNA